MENFQGKRLLTTAQNPEEERPFCTALAIYKYSAPYPPYIFRNKMLRKTSWRNTVSHAVSSNQDQALNTTMLLLKSYGPTAFLLREDGETRNFKLGLVERQLLELFQGLHQSKTRRTHHDPFTASGSLVPVSGQEAGSVCRKIIQAQDVCPICQEELLQKKLPVCYCRFGCGNNVHVSCMKVWADHQKLPDKLDTVKCPLCREDFSSLKLLDEQVKNTARLFTAAEREKPERHLGVFCQGCQVRHITGRCTVCKFFHLCEDCSKRGCHPQHPLASRTSVLRLLLSMVSVAADTLSEDVLERLPAVRVRSGSRLLDEGLQCRICLQSFGLGQLVRTLPCHHKFHMDCVDRFLRTSNSCPLDGYVVHSPLNWRCSDKTSHKSSSHLSNNWAEPVENKLKDLFVPGVALQATHDAKVSPAKMALNLEVKTDPSRPLNKTERFTAERLKVLCITGTGHASKAAHSVPLEKTLSHGGQRVCKGFINKRPANIRRSEGTKVKEVSLFVGSSRHEADHAAAVTTPAT
ncbi:unnamed protein product [Menidia menidia]|uniref:(Atlantic silverside) hypothetical protein n=1 Tax=Menidia menidia TaxID=238744 RepID=A0A8S4BDG9_9TELE|nr:unnamed protein product [Menidia menidia]